jgi:uncharacterized protein
MASLHGRFVWYELMTTDVKAAADFYANVVGWTAHDVSLPAMPYSVFKQGETSVGGLMELPREARDMGSPPRWLGYVAVDDVDACAGRATQLGGAVHVPPTDIPGVGRFTVMTDPQRAMLALIRPQNGAPTPPDASSAPGHVDWHELLAADWQQAFAFYSALLGWEKAETDSGPMGAYQLFAAGGRTIGGMSTKPAQVSIPFWLYCVNVADVDAASARLRTAGGRIVEGPTAVPGGGRIVRCIDPQGAMFALMAKAAVGAVGYFEDAQSRDALGHGRRWSW